MATPFVPVPFPADRTGACRSWAKRECEHQSPESTFSESAVIPWFQTAAWRTQREDMLDGPSTVLEGEERVRDSWVERPITPTLLGYETLEERAKFTVYKIHVTTAEGDSWVIFRRYTDFCRLNDKVKELYPSADLALPPKRWFKDNYDEEFLEERLTGLQTFLESLTSHREFFKSEAVRHFLCLVDPPGPFDSLVESRAFCETLEETNHRLQKELLDNQREVDALKKILEEKENHISLLVKKAKSLMLHTESSEGCCQQTGMTVKDTNPHQEGDRTVTGSEEKHTNGSETAEDGGGVSTNEESSHETTSYIYPLCYWY